MANGGGSQSWGDLQNAYGLSDSQVNSLKSAGYTNDQASQLLGLSITQEQSSPGNTLSVIGGGQAGGLSPSTLIGLAGALKGGGGGGGGGLPTGAVDPSRSLENLGAAALNQQAVYNPQPGAGQQGGQQQGADFLKSGVQQIGGPTMTAGVPSVQQGPWTRVPGVFTTATGAVTPGTQIAPVTPLSGTAPTTGPGTGTTPGPTQMTMQPGFAPVPPTAARPITPTPQPTAAQVGQPTPWATAPAAPGATAAAPMPMQGGGGGFYPPAPIRTGGGGPIGSGAGFNAAPGAAAINAQPLGGVGPSPPKRFQYGGIVTQPTNAIIGEAGPEAVIPLDTNNQGQINLNTPEGIALLRSQVRAQNAAGDVNPRLMASTGPTIGRPTPTAQGQETAQGQQAAQYGQQTPMTNRIWQGAPAAPGGTSAGAQRLSSWNHLPDHLKPSTNYSPEEAKLMTPSQDYANWANQQPGSNRSFGYGTDPSSGAIYDPSGNVYMSPGSGYTTKGGALYDPSGNVYMSNPSAAAGGGAAGGGGANVGSTIAGGISGIGSALANAFNQIAGQSWKIQPSAIPNPESFPKPQTTQFQSNRVT